MLVYHKSTSLSSTNFGVVPFQLLMREAKGLLEMGVEPSQPVWGRNGTSTRVCGDTRESYMVLGVLRRQDSHPKIQGRRPRRESGSPGPLLCSRELSVLGWLLSGDTKKGLDFGRRSRQGGCPTRRVSSRIANLPIGASGSGEEFERFFSRRRRRYRILASCRIRKKKRS